MVEMQSLPIILETLDFVKCLFLALSAPRSLPGVEPSGELLASLRLSLACPNEFADQFIGEFLLEHVSFLPGQ